MLAGRIVGRLRPWRLAPAQSRRNYDVSGYEATNEPVLEFLEGSDERRQLEAALAEYEAAGPKRVPICIGDREIFLDGSRSQLAPFDHSRRVATFDWAPRELIQEAIDSCLQARDRWERTPWQERAEILLRAADLVSGPYRARLLAATMLGQAKTVQQAEIDAAAELADFFRFNVANMAKVSGYRPISTQQADNSMQQRGCEGFWAAISPFNFTAIGGNLAASPAFAGNCVVWKPTDTALLSNHVVYQLLREAGMPPGVVNFVPADGPLFGAETASRPELAGVNFTGSVATFRSIWQQVSSNLRQYRTFPRLIGECGGKNFHFVHPSADAEQAAICTIRSAFEYSGQKCSACSRLYAPRSLWPQLRDRLLQLTTSLRVGSPLDIGATFTSAVIDAKAFERISTYQQLANDASSQRVSLLAGGGSDSSVGYYIQPTLLLTEDPQHPVMREEIFGPVLIVFVYPDDQVEETLELVDSTTPYALTGAVFANDDSFLQLATERLRQATGNFYVNVMSTGSVVGQQPFGGARLSGTNDKAGGPHYLLRFTSPLSVKRQLLPVTTHLPPQVKE